MSKAYCILHPTWLPDLIAAGDLDADTPLLRGEVGVLGGIEAHVYSRPQPLRSITASDIADRRRQMHRSELQRISRRQWS